MAAALMCCGRLPWRCRRKILADHFAARASERSMDSRVERASRVRATQRSLSILSQLSHEGGGDAADKLGEALHFQFFPSCFGPYAASRGWGEIFELSILSQLLQLRVALEEAQPPSKPLIHPEDSFNSFPVASRPTFVVQVTRRGRLSFQFFPSCFADEELLDARRALFKIAFNSFPVASIVVPVRTILFQDSDFQFFPSCFSHTSKWLAPLGAFGLSILSQLLREGLPRARARVEKTLSILSQLLPAASPWRC